MTISIPPEDDSDFLLALRITTINKINSIIAPTPYAIRLYSAALIASLLALSISISAFSAIFLLSLLKFNPSTLIESPLCSEKPIALATKLFTDVLVFSSKLPSSTTEVVILVIPPAD